MAFRKAIKIYRLKVKNSLMQRMAYPVNFFVMAFAVLMQAALNIVFVKVIYRYVSDISGWTQEQALIVVATYLLIEGLIWATTAYVAGIRNNIRTGTLDYELVKPMDPQFLVSVWRIDPEDFVRIFVASYLLIAGMLNTHLPIYIWAVKIGLYALLLINAYVIFYSILIIVNTVYFWAIESGSLTIIIEGLIRTAQYPSDIFFHKSVRLFFSSVVPIVFIATVPAKAVVGGIDAQYMFYSTSLAAGLYLISRKLWLHALNHYSSASS